MPAAREYVRSRGDYGSVAPGRAEPRQSKPDGCGVLSERGDAGKNVVSRRFPRGVPSDVVAGARRFSRNGDTPASPHDASGVAFSIGFRWFAAMPRGARWVRSVVERTAGALGGSRKSAQIPQSFHAAKVLRRGAASATVFSFSEGA